MVCLLLFGCDSPDNKPFTLTNEQAVYETVALKYLKSMVKKIDVLNETNGEWFQTHSLDELKQWAISEENGKVIHFQAPATMLEELHATDQQSEDINWQPIIIDGSLIPTEKLKTAAEYFSFSRVVFSDDKKFALVQFTHHCVLCGGAWISYLRFENKQWHIIESWALWLS